MSGRLPEGWLHAPLTRISINHDSRRVPLNATERAARPGHYPYYGANGQVDTIGDYLFDGEYILLAEDGGFFDDPTRNVAYAVHGKFWVNNHAHILSPIGGIPTRFLLHTLNRIDWMPYVSGTTRLKLTQGGMNRVQVDIPPLNEQRRIVAKIEALMARSTRAKEALDAIPALLDRYRQSVLAAAFRGDLTADWREENARIEPAINMIDRARRSDVVDGSEAGLPSTWCDAPLASILKATSGVAFKKSDYVSSGRRLLQIANVSYGKVIWTTENYLPENLAKNFHELDLRSGDIVMALNRPITNERLKIAQLGDEDAPATLYQRVARFDFSDVTTRDYFYAYSRGGLFLNQIKKNLQGTDQPYINTSSIPRLRMPLAPRREQIEILARLRDTTHAIRKIEAVMAAAKDQYSALDQSILAKAFRGELVPQDPNDEPALELLARIKAERTATGTPSRRGGRRKRAAAPVA